MTRAKKIEQAARALVEVATGASPGFVSSALDALRAALAPREDAHAPRTRRNAPVMCACHDGTPMPDGRCQTCLLPVRGGSVAPSPKGCERCGGTGSFPTHDRNGEVDGGYFCPACAGSGKTGGTT